MKMKNEKSQNISSEKFDEKFDQGDDVSAFVDWANASGPRFSNETSIRRVNVDFPAWMVEALDSEASRLGVTRQSIIKFWIADQLEKSKQGKASDSSQNAA